MPYKYSSCQRKGKKKHRIDDVSGLESTFTPPSLFCVKINKTNWWLIEKRMIRKKWTTRQKRMRTKHRQKSPDKRASLSLFSWFLISAQEKNCTSLCITTLAMTRIVGDERAHPSRLYILFSYYTVQLLSLPYWGERYRCVKRGCSTSRASISTLSRVNFGNCRYSITVGWGGRATGTRPTSPTQLF